MWLSECWLPASINSRLPAVLSAHWLFSLPFRPGTFRPLAFLGLLLVSVTAFPTAQVQHDFTADTTDEMTTAEMTTTMPNKPTTSASQVFQMFMRVYQAVKELKNEVGNLVARTWAFIHSPSPRMDKKLVCWEVCAGFWDRLDCGLYFFFASGIRKFLYFLKKCRMGLELIFPHSFLASHLA